MLIEEVLLDFIYAHPSEEVSWRPRLRLAGGGGVGICSTSQSRLTRILPLVSSAVPPDYEIWSLKYFRGSRAQAKTSARLLP